MPVTFREENRRLTAAVSGELDHHRAREVMEELDRRIDAALPRELVLDLGGLTFTGTGTVITTTTTVSDGNGFTLGGEDNNNVGITTVYYIVND